MEKVKQFLMAIPNALKSILQSIYMIAMRIAYGKDGMQRVMERAQKDIDAENRNTELGKASEKEIEKMLRQAYEKEVQQAIKDGKDIGRLKGIRDVIYNPKTDGYTIEAIVDGDKDGIVKFDLSRFGRVTEMKRGQAADVKEILRRIVDERQVNSALETVQQLHGRNNGLDADTIRQRMHENEEPDYDVPFADEDEPTTPDVSENVVFEVQEAREGFVTGKSPSVSSPDATNAYKLKEPMTNCRPSVSVSQEELESTMYDLLMLKKEGSSDFVVANHMGVAKVTENGRKAFAVVNLITQESKLFRVEKFEKGERTDQEYADEAKKRFNDGLKECMQSLRIPEFNLVSDQTAINARAGTMLIHSNPAPETNGVIIAKNVDTATDVGKAAYADGLRLVMREYIRRDSKQSEEVRFGEVDTIIEKYGDQVKEIVRALKDKDNSAVFYKGCIFSSQGMALNSEGGFGDAMKVTVESYDAQGEPEIVNVNALNAEREIYRLISEHEIARGLEPSIARTENNRGEITKNTEMMFYRDDNNAGVITVEYDTSDKNQKGNFPGTMSPVVRVSGNVEKIGLENVYEFVAKNDPDAIGGVKHQRDAYVRTIYDAVNKKLCKDGTVCMMEWLALECVDAKTREFRMTNLQNGVDYTGILRNKDSVQNFFTKIGYNPEDPYTPLFEREGREPKIPQIDETQEKEPAPEIDIQAHDISEDTDPGNGLTDEEMKAMYENYLPTDDDYVPEDDGMYNPGN